MKHVKWCLFIYLKVHLFTSKQKERSKPKPSLPKLPVDAHSYFACLFWKAVHKFCPSGIVAPGFLEVRDNKTLLDHSVHLTANVRQNNNKITALSARKFLLPATNGIYSRCFTPLCIPHAQAFIYSLIFWYCTHPVTCGCSIKLPSTRHP